MLGTALQRLAGIVLCVILGLLGAVANKTGSGTTEGASGPIAETRGEVINLTGSLLALALGVLLTSGLLQVLRAFVVRDANLFGC
jgi:hypothetical protein